MFWIKCWFYLLLDLRQMPRRPSSLGRASFLRLTPHLGVLCAPPPFPVDRQKSAGAQLHLQELPLTQWHRGEYWAPYATYMED